MFRLIPQLFLSMTLLLGGCAGTKQLDDTSRPQAEVEDRAVLQGDVIALPDQAVIRTEELHSEEKVSPVVQKLLVSAEQQRGLGNSDGAANSLERALRIEPKNAILWSRLADIRYAQSDWQQAVQLAAKSNTLASSNQQLLRRNWYLMANAYAAMDDLVQAQKYRDKLNSY